MRYLDDMPSELAALREAFSKFPKDAFTPDELFMPFKGSLLHIKKGGPIYNITEGRESTIEEILELQEALAKR